MHVQYLLSQSEVTWSTFVVTSHQNFDTCVDYLSKNKNK